MGKTLCYSVRYSSMANISPKAVVITSFDGSEDVIPKSQIFGIDYEVAKSEAIWVAAWILEKKSIQYSTKKAAYFDSESRKRLTDIQVIKHKAAPVEVSKEDRDEIAELKSDRG